ncbi:hypothetical cytosolic protein [Syntrophus aciditrophicus SB]|uniref:Hypothetical cytosolic protein n=1 Tax=Syntrophus aciditrophicus (strain SB) TaxID=56780 RepID=Q2LW79_SYNAS|nr:hypothetical cytosolic protein [Syntrophus aciditrophicus SB]
MCEFLRYGNDPVFSACRFFIDMDLWFLYSALLKKNPMNAFTVAGATERIAFIIQ